MHVISPEHRCSTCAALSGVPVVDWSDLSSTIICPLQAVPVTSKSTCAFWHSEDGQDVVDARIAISDESHPVGRGWCEM